MRTAYRHIFGAGLAAGVLTWSACGDSSSGSRARAPTTGCAGTSTSTGAAGSGGTTPSLAVFDGDSIPASTDPFVGALFFTDSQSEGMCTAELVCANVVLTAAHCFEGISAPPSSYKFTLSPTVPFTGQPSDATNLPADATAGVSVTVDPLRATSDKTETRGPDLAFLQLSHGFPPPYAQLQYTAMPDPATPDQGAPGEAVGYGESTNAGDGVGTKREGQLVFAGTNTGDPGTVFATRGAKGQGTCEGDSGGPLLINNEVYGILSGGDSEECGDPNAQGVYYYASVPNSAAWLQSTITQLCKANVSTSTGQITPGTNESSVSSLPSGETSSSAPCTVP